MWVYTKQRDEHDNRDLVNLDHCARIHINQLGERWFIDALQGSETVSLAQVKSETEALDIVKRVYAGLSAGESAIDLNEGGHPSDSEEHISSGHGDERRRDEAQPAGH